MKARALLLIGFVVGLLFLMALLTRWAQEARLEGERRQLLALRERATEGRGGVPATLRDAPETTAPSAPVFALRPKVLHTQEVVPSVSSPLVSYLSRINTLERDRQQVWHRWQEGLSSLPTPTPSPSEPAPPPLDLLAEAERWDKLLGSAPDSACLPFHLVYRQYLAQERDYLERLVFLKERGELVQLALLQQEWEAQRSLLVGRLEGRLREIQLAHPDLPKGLKSFHIQ